MAGAAIVAAAGLVAATLAATTTSAGAAGTETVQTAVRACPNVTAHHSACDAMRAVVKTVSVQRAQKLEAEGRARPTPTKRLGFGPAGGYTPAQLAKAYGINPKAKTKQTVAIVDAFNDPSVRKDLNTFDKHYGIKHETKKSFRVIGQNGGAPPTTNDEGWAGEITLDVESVRSVCRNCKILLVEANNNNDANLARAVKEAIKKHAKVVSNSYGGPETPADPKWIRKAYSHKHVAILASSGDSGWYDWDTANGYAFDSSAVSSDQSQTPASYPSVVGVGGTSLYLNPNGSRASETVWNEDGPGDLDGSFIYAGTYSPTSGGYDPGAAGSGCSHKYKAPKWQRKVKGYNSVGCGKKRSEVDIAALADPWTGFDIYESFDWCTNVATCSETSADDGWATYGGTSLASPLVGGMWGLAGGPKGATNAASILYANYKKHKSDTYDIKVGGTGGCDTQSPRACGGFLQDMIYGGVGSTNPNAGPAGMLDCAWARHGSKVKKNRGQCYAQPGYDGVAGVGTPKGLKVFK